MQLANPLLQTEFRGQDRRHAIGLGPVRMVLEEAKFRFSLLEALGVLLTCLELQARPVDDIPTWLQFGHFACWAASPFGYEGCCGWEFGPGGNPECWVAYPLNYENCCLERWRLCDISTMMELHEDRVDVFSTFAGLFFTACGKAQAYLNAVRGATEQLVWQGPEDADVEKIRALATDLVQSLPVHSMERVAVPSSNQSVWKGARNFLILLEEWAPAEIADVLEMLSRQASSSALNTVLSDLLEDTFERVAQFRDALLNALYADELQVFFEGCGDVCDTKASLGGRNMKHVDCEVMLASAALQTHSVPRAPPPSIPPILRQHFTMNDQVPVLSHSAIRQALGFSGGQLPQKQHAEPEWLWNAEAIATLIERAKNSTLSPGPTSLERVNALAEVLGSLPSSVEGQSWAVWGDCKHFEWWSPWMEALLLSFGAKTVASIVPSPDRYRAPSLHEGLRPISVQQASRDAPFDGFVLLGLATIGTGRHGDRLNPFADLQQAAAAWCMLRPGGLVLAPPMAEFDLLRWPAGRAHGPLRWPHLTANFQLLYMNSVIAVLSKPFGPEDATPTSRRFKDSVS